MRPLSPAMIQALGYLSIGGWGVTMSQRVRAALEKRGLIEFGFDESGYRFTKITDAGREALARARGEHA